MCSEQKDKKINCPERGSVQLPRELEHFLGADKNSHLRYEIGDDGVKIYPNIHSLSKV